MPTYPPRAALPGILLLLLANCARTLPASPAPFLVGLEPMADAAAQARLLANLAAAQLPVVDLTDARNAWAFEALSAPKLRLSVRLQSGALCLTSRYTVWTNGSLLYSSLLAVPEPDTDGRADTCIALFVSRFRGDLWFHGLSTAPLMRPAIPPAAVIHRPSPAPA